MGRVSATHFDELPGHTAGKQWGDPKYDDAGMTNVIADPSHRRALLEAAPEEKTVSEYLAALQDRLRAVYLHARVNLQRAAMQQRHDYDGKDQRQEYQAGDLVWIHDIMLGRDRGMKLLFPLAWTRPHHQGVGSGTSGRATLPG